VAPVFLQEIGPLERRLTGVGAASVHGEQVDRAAIRVLRARDLALQRETARERVDGRALLAAVEVAQDRERLPGAIDGSVCLALEGCEAGLADAQHSQIRRLGSRAEQTLCAFQLLTRVLDR